jgi:hypothetical protein
MLLFGAVGTARAAPIGWPEAVGRLAEQRSKAETCAAALKAHGNKAQIARGRLAYGTVKASFDAVIAGLITALAEGGSPQSLPNLKIALQQGTTGLKAFCGTAYAVMPKVSGRRDVVADIVKLVLAVHEGRSARR